jgi:hypothetical protein
MKLRRGLGMLMVTSTVVVVALVQVTVPLGAQEPGTSKRSANKGYDAARRVPPYFGQVGLSVEQREAIYKIRAQHMERIEALQQQIEQEETQMMAESEAVLTDAQRRLLEDRRSTVKGKAGPAAKGKESTKPTTRPAAKSPR